METKAERAESPQLELLPATRWRIVGLPDWPHRVSIELTMDTTVASIVDDVERAARLAGIELERVAA